MIGSSLVTYYKNYCKFFILSDVYRYGFDIVNLLLKIGILFLPENFLKRIIIPCIAYIAILHLGPRLCFLLHNTYEIHYRNRHIKLFAYHFHRPSIFYIYIHHLLESHASHILIQISNNLTDNFLNYL